MQPKLIKRHGRVIAEIRADGVLQKHIRGSVHFLRKPCRSIAFDISILEQAVRAGAFWAEVHDDESGQVYHTAIAYIQDHGFQINYAGPQIALPVSQWFKGPVETEPKEQLEQLQLFGGAQ